MEADEEHARSVDPLYDQRTELPVHEFDAVHFYCNEPRRSPAPPPGVAAYFDSGLSRAELADRIDRIVVDMTEAVGRFTPLPMRLRFVQWQLVGPGFSRLDGSPQSLAELVAALRTTPPVHSTHLSFLAEDDPPQEYSSWGLGCYFPWPRTAPDTSTTMWLVGSPDLWPDADSADRAAQQILNLLVSWCGPLALRTAGVTYDRSGPERSPWERWYGLTSNDTAPVTRNRVRGYYWANLLTAGHLDRFGGPDRLRKLAAEHGFLAEPVPSVPDATVVRAPGTITGLDDEQLAAMKDLLRPVLIPRRYLLYQGYPLRIVPDPGTAFRRVSADGPFPRLLAGEGPLTSDPD